MFLRIFFLTRSKYAFLPTSGFIGFHYLSGRRQSLQIVVTNSGPECHLLSALRAVFPAEGAERFQVSRGS